MSQEEEILNALELTEEDIPEIKEEPEVEEVEPTPVPERQYTALEQEAMEDGWTDKETWEKAGKDPERWKPAFAFIEHGKLMKALNSKTKEIDERIDNLRKYNEVQMEATLAELRSQQRTALQYADVETFDNLQAKIDNFNKALQAPQPNTPQIPVEISAWEARNKWVFENTPKAAEAKALFAAHRQVHPDASPADTLKYVDGRIKDLYPEENPRRNVPTMTEQGKQPATSPKKGIGWNDLTPQEVKDWDKFGATIFGGDKKAFLKTVIDARKLK